MTDSDIPWNPPGQLLLGIKFKSRKHAVKAQPYLKNKNPLHSSALRVGDLTINRTVIVFHALSGVVGTFRIISPVFANPVSQAASIRVLEIASGQRITLTLYFMGVLLSADGRWSESITIDHRKQSLLPESDGIWFDPWKFLSSPRTTSPVMLPVGPISSGKSSLASIMRMRAKQKADASRLADI